MFFKNYHLTFTISLIAGTLIAVSANSWFTRWLGLEINLISIIPLMLIRLNKNFTEAAIKYFIAQAFASVLLIFIIVCNFLNNEVITLTTTEIFIIFSLRLKRGLAPFHYWFPQVANLLNWSQCLIIFTWQKIAPLLLLFSLNLKLIFLVSRISALTGSLGGLNQNLAKLIIAYSSISHRGWILLSCALNITSWLFYFFIYSFLSCTILVFFWINQIVKINQIYSCQDSVTNKCTLTLNLLSLAGIPPLIGFFAKLAILLISLKIKILIIFIPLILRSLISLFFYTRLIYSNLIRNTSRFFNLANFNKSPINFFYSGRVFFNLLFPTFFILS